MIPTNYVIDTKDWYQHRDIAEKYRAYHTKGLSWIRFMMWRQQKIIASELRHLIKNQSEIIADFPCGTGLLAKVLSDQAAKSIPLDISLEMLNMAKNDYAKEKTLGFACADITKSPFLNNSLNGLLTIGLIHRLPREVRDLALKEMARITKDWIVLTFSTDSAFQRLKRQFLRAIYPGYRPAPSPINLQEIKTTLAACGYILEKRVQTFPVLSSDNICIFKKSPEHL